MKKFLIALIAPLAVLACGQKDNPSQGGSEEPTTGISKPANVKLVEATENSLSFSWDAVSGADSYSYKLTASGQKTVTGSVTAPAVTVEALKAATEYAFQVLAVAGESKSLYSNAVKAKTLSDEDPGDNPGENPGGTPVATICVDQPLVFTVEGTTPQLGTSGLIQVYDESGSVVDKIDMADMATVTVLSDGTMVPAGADADANPAKIAIDNDTPFHTFMNALHSGQYRIVHYTPVRVNGKSVEVRLHNDVLAFGKKYTVSADASCFGIPVTREDFVLQVKAAPSGSTLKVAQDGSADFCTVQGALSYASTLGKDAAVTVEVATGTYKEMLFLRNKNNVTIKGVSREATVIAYPNNDTYETGSGSSVASKPALGSSIGKSGGRSVFLVESCDNLTLESLTIENTYSIPSHKGQAETMYFNDNTNERKLVIEDCALISWQDTFLCKGEVWVHNSLVAGHVDYIWGYPKACLFEDCEIRSRAGGYIVQARVNNATDKGFVFLNCRLTAESGVASGSMYLARSGGDTSKYDNVTFVNCEMSSVIAPAGWHTGKTPTPAEPTAVSGWKEYGTTGVSTSSRNNYGRTLTDEEAKAFSSKQAVLGW